jgi:phytoene dehydrogenase-like protein
LYKLACRHGVSFYFNKPVERIIQSDDKVQGVVVDNQNISADVVLSNVDAYFTHKHLLANDESANKLLRQERSSSALIFYWGIKRIFPQLGLHNIFFSGDYNAEFDHIFKFKKPYTDPTIYINITSKYEPGVHAPDGCENWFVMINMPACTDLSPLAIENCKKSILSRLSRQLKVDVASLIDSEAILDPATIQLKTGSYMGSLYGTSSNSTWAAFLRHPNFSKNIKGLYFTGGSVHPGGGIPLCLRSAKIVSELILDSLN